MKRGLLALGAFCILMILMLYAQDGKTNFSSSIEYQPIIFIDQYTSAVNFQTRSWTNPGGTLAFLSLLLTTENDQPKLVVSADLNPVCQGEESTLTASVTGGGGEIIYQWYDGDNNLISANSAITVQPEQTTTYTVTANDGSNPILTESITLEVYPSPQIINTPNSQTNISGATPNPKVIEFQSDIDNQVTYTWSTLGNSNLENSYPLSGTGNLEFFNPFIILPSGNETEILEYTIYPIYNGELKDCTGQQFTYSVIVKQTPTLFQVEGGGAFCNDGENCVSITLSGSQDGVNYQLRKDNVDFGNVMAGKPTGLPIVWPCISEAGNYTVRAINLNSLTSAIMQGSAMVTPRNLPQVFNISPLAPGDNCVPVVPWLSGSEPDVIYRLSVESDGMVYPNIQELTGDGNPLTFSSQAQTGIYKITAIYNHPEVSCSVEMNGEIEAVPLPLEFPVIPTEIICVDTEAICISMSETGVEYELWLNNQPVPGTQQVGNGGQICFGTLSEPGTYSIRAKNPAINCALFFEQTITIAPPPLVYNVSPEVGCPGTVVSLTGCEASIDYFLFLKPNGQDQQFEEIMGPVSCDENDNLNFGPQTIVGTYRVKAINTTAGCERWMTGEVVIHNPPAIFNLTANGVALTQSSYCPGTEIGLEFSQSGVNYHLIMPSGDSLVLTGVGDPISFGTFQVPGPYSITAIDPFTSCYSHMEGEINITTGIEITILGSLATCVSDAIEIPAGFVAVINGENFHWSVKDLSGAGTINNGNTLQPTYLPHPSDAGKTVVLEITADGISSCNDSQTTAELQIKIGTQPQVSISVVDNQVDSTRCQNASVYFTQMLDFENSSPHPDQIISRRVWEIANNSGYLQTIETVNSSTIEHVFSQSGDFEITLTIEIMIDNVEICVSTETTNVTIHPTPIAGFIAHTPDNCEYTVRFEDTSTTPNNAINSWFWDFGDNNILTIYDSHPMDIFHDYALVGTYTVSLQVTDQFGCVGEYSNTDVGIQCVEHFSFFVPNAFVPDHADPEVSVFKPKGMNIDEYHIIIMDRWGNPVWESKALDNGSPSESWDGYFKGQKMPQGVYVWTAYVKFLDGSLWQGNDNGSISGPLTILR